MKKRAIYAEDLQTVLRDDPHINGTNFARVRRHVNEMPAVEAVEVTKHEEVVHKLECLLCHATGGKYSKAGYSWEDMERMVTDYIEECCEEAVAEKP